jgi:hypothetical protein
MAQNCVVTCTWMIMGHGVVYRYATDQSLFPPGSDEERRATTIIKKEKDKPPPFIRFIPPFDETKVWECDTTVWNNTNYLSMATPWNNSKSMVENGWQAQELMFRDVFAGSSKSQPEIEKELQFIEDISHAIYNFNIKWSIYENIKPWEKGFAGYKIPDPSYNEKESWTKSVKKIEKNGKIYKFNAALDPNVGTRPIGGAFCRLMMINVTNKNLHESNTSNRNQNFYYGDKTTLILNDNRDGDWYGINLGNHHKNLKMVSSECWKKTQYIIKNEFKDLANNCTLRMFIYDTTCNGNDRWVTPEQEKLIREDRNKQKLKAQAILDKQTLNLSGSNEGGEGGGNQHGGALELAEIEDDLERMMNKQSEFTEEPKDDPYNVALNIMFDLKELAEKDKKGSDKSSSASSS